MRLGPFMLITVTPEKHDGVTKMLRAIHKNIRMAATHVGPITFAIMWYTDASR